MTGSGLTLIENILPEEPSTSIVGNEGERLAAAYLRRLGYTLVARNFKVPVGRNRNGAQITGEIDLIALDSDVLCFVEVKSRSGTSLVPPVASVDRRKQRQIVKTARIYRRLFGLERIRSRYDGIGITILPGSPPLIDHRKAYWDESVTKRSP